MALTKTFKTENLQIRESHLLAHRSSITLVSPTEIEVDVEKLLWEEHRTLMHRYEYNFALHEVWTWLDDLDGFVKTHVLEAGFECSYVGDEFVRISAEALEEQAQNSPRNGSALVDDIFHELSDELDDLNSEMRDFFFDDGWREDLDMGELMQVAAQLCAHTLNQSNDENIVAGMDY